MTFHPRHLLCAAAASSLAAVSAPANATSWNVFTDYGSSVFSYGSGIGSSVSTFKTTYGSGCFGDANFACMNSGGGDSSVPAVGVVTSGPNATFLGIDVPTGVVWMHPDNGATPPTSVVFTAPTAGMYSISGYFERVDTTSDGTGVGYNVYDNATSVLSGNLPASSYGSSPSTFSDTLTLAAGDTISFSVSNVGGNYSYDSTGLSATITAVPEPATWTLMLGGVALVGGMARSRRRSAVAA